MPYCFDCGGKLPDGVHGHTRRCPGCKDEHNKLRGRNPNAVPWEKKYIPVTQRLLDELVVAGERAGIYHYTQICEHIGLNRRWLYNMQQAVQHQQRVGTTPDKYNRVVNFIKEQTYC